MKLVMPKSAGLVRSTPRSNTSGWCKGACSRADRRDCIAARSILTMNCGLSSCQRIDRASVGDGSEAMSACDSTAWLPHRTMAQCGQVMRAEPAAHELARLVQVVAVEQAIALQR